MDSTKGGSSESGSGMEKGEGMETFLSLTHPYRDSVAAELRDHHPICPAHQGIREVCPCFKPKDGVFFVKADDSGGSAMSGPDSRQSPRAPMPSNSARIWGKGVWPVPIPELCSSQHRKAQKGPELHHGIGRPLYQIALLLLCHL